jgi:choline dehydrogenase
VILDDEQRATGVEYMQGRHLYRADPKAPLTGPRPAVVVSERAKREVILSAGAFNTPQLLMLSGIGPKEELEKHGIKVRVDLPGVGRNLQDRYEVGVVSKMKRNFAILKGATFSAPKEGEAPDPQFKEWLEGRGVYTTNGAIIAIAKRSEPSRPLPDLYLFGLAGNFKGYYPGYSKDVSWAKDYFTWCVLKAHTNNTAGYVKLRSNDPRDTPEINFKYFDEGSDASGEDLASVVAGVKFVRKILAETPDLIAEESVPGPAVATDEQVAQFVKDNAWGHHASCTCKIGRRDDPSAVLDSKFRVFGTKGLRVVDASVFPRIPGFFIVSAVYMVSEKAAEEILSEARSSVAATNR